MRPRYLEIEGLQSFREAQKIDFIKLGETGLFGIFGPTGSGKSTVLDAITLALYGSVARAKHNTQGIINSTANAASVSFTFDLARDGARKTFRVERSYRRKKDQVHAAEARVARLIEITGGMELPLCDKAGEVTDKVIELIGLKLEDFTRSVVLPQNKFQDFLLSAKSEKRAMLERIFYMEEYGKLLSEKVSRKLAMIKNELSRLDGAMSQLGDASEKALIEAEHSMKAAYENKEQLTANVKAAEERFNNARETRGLVEELEELHIKERLHLQEKDAVEEKQHRLSDALKAQGLAGPVARYKETAGGLEEALHGMKELGAALPEVEGRLDKLRQEAGHVKKEAEIRRPTLIERKAKLNDALGILNETAQLDKELLALRQEYRAVKDKLALCEAKLSAQQQKIHQDEQSAEMLKKEADALKVDLVHRDEMQALARLEEELKRSGLELERLNKASESVYKRLENTEKEALEAMQALENVKSLIQSRSAVMLALSLEEGKPCPVCGSEHHPVLAHSSEATDEAGLRLRMEELTAKTDLAEARKNDARAELIKVSEQARLMLQQLERLEGEGATAAAFERKMDQIRELMPLLAQKQSSMKKRLDAQLKAYGNSTAGQRLLQIHAEERSAEQKRKEAERLLDVLKGEWEVQEELLREKQDLRERFAAVEEKGIHLNKQKKSLEEKLLGITEGKEAAAEIIAAEKELEALAQREAKVEEELAACDKMYAGLKLRWNTLEEQRRFFSERLTGEKQELDTLLAAHEFESIEQAESALLTAEQQFVLENEINAYNQMLHNLQAQIQLRRERLKGASLSREEFAAIAGEYQSFRQGYDESIQRLESAKNAFRTMKSSFDAWIMLHAERQKFGRRAETLDQIQKLLRGNAFVEYIAEERLRYIAKEATMTLGVLTRYRYALELDPENGFIIRDHANGGAVRLVSTLSGGETFLTALSLALALSKQIQLKGQSPLEFFFLDEGFGTLDGGLLDAVMDALERLSTQERMIGVISHVPEMRNRVARRLIVTPPAQDGKGSRLMIEKA